jgi:mucin-like protein
MKKLLLGVIAPCLLLVSIDSGAAPEVVDYANTCKSALGFAYIPEINCNEGVKFAGGVVPPPGQPSRSLINDYVGYKWITDYVDAVFACRWLSEDGNFFANGKPFTNAASVELLVHNRQTGKTCFFAGKPMDSDPPRQSVKAKLKSPTASDAYIDWMAPSDLNLLVPPNNGDIRCASCHVAGPYIASGNIASALARFGLLNDGHDDFAVVRSDGTRYQAVSTGPGTAAFASWNSTLIDAFNVQGGCASGCHSIARKAMNPGLISGEQVIPGIQQDITDVTPLMPISDRALAANSPAASDYRWMNVDIPGDPNGGGEAEMFYQLKGNSVGFTPELNKALTCPTEPLYMEAHRVGSDLIASTRDPYPAAAIPDKLAKFDQTGLICHNAEQANGKCSNYVVRFNCIPDKFSVYSAVNGNLLTIALKDANGVRYLKGQPFNAEWAATSSQSWSIEAVGEGTHYNYVRLANSWISVNLNADSTDGVVTVAGKDNTWQSEKWVMEYVGGTHYVRFRSLWKTGMYLTMMDNTSYAPVALRPLRTDATVTAQNWELK